MSMKQIFLFLMVILTIGTAKAQVSSIEVLAEKDTVWTLPPDYPLLGKRQMHRIDIAYNSVDPDGNPARLSGSIIIPADVYSGEQPCDGIVLHHPYFRTNFQETVTRGYATGMDCVMAIGLKPNYIVVESDCWGFGITEGQTQALLWGMADAQASIDCLLSARQLLDQRGISQGKYLFNVGYSSAANSALATQILRDQKYRDVINFDRTMVGGGSYNLNEMFMDRVSDPDKVVRSPWDIVVVLVCYNKLGKLGYTNQQLFKEPIASDIETVFLSGKNDNKALTKKYGFNHRIGDWLADELFDPNTKLYQDFHKLFLKGNLLDGWTPDPSQSYYVSHLLRDEVFPVSNAHTLVDFLCGTGHFEQSLILGQTNLQTNIMVNSNQHTLVGGTMFYLNTALALSFWPVLYCDGEMNPYYAKFVKNLTPQGIVSALEAKGVNVSKLLEILSGLMGTLKEGKESQEFNKMLQLVLSLPELPAAGRTAPAEEETVIIDDMDMETIKAVEREKGTFTVGTLNVDGLPKKYLFLTVNGDGPGVWGSLAISNYLREKQLDFIGLQENFNYSKEIFSLLGDYDHDEWSGGFNLTDKNVDLRHLHNSKLSCDGLNALWRKDITVTKTRREAYYDSFGKLSHSNDAFITKGFRRYEIELPEGDQLVVYDTHLDASELEDELTGNDYQDKLARMSEWRQLIDDIIVNMDQRPVVLLGDFNSYYCRDALKDLLDAVNNSGRGTASDAWVELTLKGQYPQYTGVTPIITEENGWSFNGETPDKIIYINPVYGCSIQPVSIIVDTEDYVKNGKALGDHYPVIAKFRYVDTARQGDASGITDIRQVTAPTSLYSLDGTAATGRRSGIYVEHQTNGKVRKVVRR